MKIGAIGALGRRRDASLDILFDAPGEFGAGTYTNQHPWSDVLERPQQPLADDQQARCWVAIRGCYRGLEPGHRPRRALPMTSPRIALRCSRLSRTASRTGEMPSRLTPTFSMSFSVPRRSSSAEPSQSKRLVTDAASA